MLQDRTKNTGGFSPAPDDGLIICRCEEITKGEIRRAIQDGLLTLTELRRFLRAGMGLCQGQTCGRLVKSILARELGVPPAALEPVVSRAPVRPVEMQVLARDQEIDHD
ncbi:MAG: (2Fe-2S)-binding protein [Candidatus Margulisbacteria bacterium]|jgi:NAD(P)H-nitrite reductase large subunit|nr:(2Fe-2S)-binding protein [Candidatus Margulisiibacteriota bacterium]